MMQWFESGHFASVSFGSKGATGPNSKNSWPLTATICRSIWTRQP